MPQGETFWNPYRWVPINRKKPDLAKPHYHHTFEGLRGFMECRLTALTPLLIGGAQKTQSGAEEIHFLRSQGTNQFVIPGTSLKGMIRSLYELLGNAAIPFSSKKACSDPDHRIMSASDGKTPPGKLDIAARVFGFLNRGAVFRGLVRFSDAHPTKDVKEIGPFEVVVGKPRPDSRESFYPDRYARKFYHHHPTIGNRLVPPPPGITQTRTVYPLPVGSEFRFRVDFENLQQEELDLLIYCLVLEDNVEVTLSPEALGPSFREPVRLTGPMRHKLGACKPQGAGSVEIVVEKLCLFCDPADRYRGKKLQSDVYTGESLSTYIAAARARAVPRIAQNTLKALRAMMIFSPDDPRKDISYPKGRWFESPETKHTPLKPTY